MTYHWPTWRPSRAGLHSRTHGADHPSASTVVPRPAGGPVEEAWRWPEITRPMGKWCLPIRWSSMRSMVSVGDIICIHPASSVPEEAIAMRLEDGLRTSSMAEAQAIMARRVTVRNLRDALVEGWPPDGTLSSAVADAVVAAVRCQLEDTRFVVVSLCRTIRHDPFLRVRSSSRWWIVAMCVRPPSGGKPAA